jgi:hypothetical protein
MNLSGKREREREPETETDRMCVCVYVPVGIQRKSHSLAFEVQNRPLKLKAGTTVLGKKAF